MKIGILSDLHGNFDATYSVLKSANKKGISTLLILGDIVGYYFEPHKIVRILKKWKCHYIKGNHESLLEDYDGRKKDNLPFYHAKKTLSKRELSFLYNIPNELSLKFNNKSFYLCHSTPLHNNEYLYPSMQTEIINTFSKKKENIILYGHTHYQFYYKNNDQLIINPGSVGQPRDRKGGACWAIYNTYDNNVSLEREKYDIKSFIKKSIKFDPNLNYRKYL